MIELHSLCHIYSSSAKPLQALDSVTLTVGEGQIAAVIGPSGSGKSTLARCASLLTSPTSGTVSINGTELTGRGAAQLRRARRSIGTVFQSSALLRRRTAAANIALPLECAGIPRRVRRERVEELLELVGLHGRGDSYPHELSGGQRQRVGIARALSLSPSVLVADEPTSGLDPATTRSILELLRDLREQLGVTILVITHEMSVVRELADTVSLLDRGRIIETGVVAEVLADPLSLLGEQLVHREHESSGAPGEIRIAYAGTDIPKDWIGRVGNSLGHDLHIEHGSIEVIRGVTVGRITVHSSPDAHRLITELTRLGINAAVVGGAQKS